MSKRKSFVATPIAHLVGPGKLRVINGRLAFVTGKDGEAVRLDAGVLRTVCCYGAVGVSDEAFHVLFEHDVEVSWLTPAGTRLPWTTGAFRCRTHSAAHAAASGTPR